MLLLTLAYAATDPSLCCYRPTGASNVSTAIHPTCAMLLPYAPTLCSYAYDPTLCYYAYAPTPMILYLSSYFYAPTPMLLRYAMWY
eukprot:3941358-Rhodomonas_salina.2